MFNPALRLPARPSLEQLRKQAKELSHSESVPLARAQFLLARKYGFDSWPKLVRHVEAILATDLVQEFERVAGDLLAGYTGDAGALERLGQHYGDSSSNERRRTLVEDRFRELLGPGVEPTMEGARLLLARQYNFDSWASFTESMAQPTKEAPPGTFTAVPPFYRIDPKHNIIELRPPLTDRDWETVVAVMTERGITGINSSAITDAAMERLSRLDFVTRLQVGGASRLTDDGLLLLERMPQVEELDLSGWHSPITDRGLAVLRHLPNLKRIQMCWPQRISDAGAANLTFCDQLESVDFMGTPTGDGTINALRGKRHLKSFKTGKLVTDRGLPLLLDFPIFREWHNPDVEMNLMSFGLETHNLMIDGTFTDAGLAGLAGLEGINGLSFFWHTSGFSGQGLEALARLPNLVFLGCDGERCTDAAMRSIAMIPRLRMLMGQGAVASDEGFVSLSQSKTLEYFWGRDCPNIRGRGFAALANLPKLTGLGVSCLNVDDASLACLPGFPSLRQLMPMDVSDEGFRHVGGCEQLEDLRCMYCRDTGDIATGYLAGLSRLKSYYAGKTRITDLSLEVLSGMPSLEKLEFWEVSGITSAGVAGLAQLPRLRELSLDNCSRVTREAVTAFPATVRVSLS